MPRPPIQIRKYEIVRRLGHGGMGTVYLARDPDLDRLLAIKVLRDPLFDEELLQRFLREARAAANLRHDNIITVYEVGQHEHQPFMAMEYVDGTSLADVIRSRPSLTLGDKLSYIDQICSGLHYAHGEGLVHRDIKPANLMVDRHGVIRILDFGIARIQGSGMTRDGAMIGTLNYMSPEQMLGRPVDYRSDIFAVGAVAYELLAYQQAFGGTLDDGLLHRLPHEDPPSLDELCPGLPSELVRIVMRALAKRPEDRFANLEEARVAVREIRRNLDPEIERTILAPRHRNLPGAQSSAPGSSAERRELLERRARQIAVHRDAAQAAFARHDLDSAIAACEDALTLDPDDAKALQLLGEIQRAKQRRDQESKERHERERTVRQRIADADLRLSRGDVSAAAAALQQALAMDPQNPAALALLPRLTHAATTAGLELPTLPVDEAGSASGLDSQAVTRVPYAFQPTVIADRAPLPWWQGVLASHGRSLAVLASVAVAVSGAIVVGVLWQTPNDDRPASGQPNPDSPAPLAAAPATSATPQPATTPAPDLPAPTVSPESSLQQQLDRVNAAYAGGDLDGALLLIEPLLKTSGDGRLQDRARQIARGALQSMGSAEAAATRQKASELSPGTLAVANRAKLRADEALRRNDYVEAGRQALAAETSYKRAESEALLAAARRVPLPAPAPEAAPPSPIVIAPPPAPAPTSTPAPVATPPIAANPAPSNTPAPTAALPMNPLDRERAGILAILTRYQDAYRDMSVQAVREVYPSLPREEGQTLEKNFRNCRSFDAAFTNIQPTMGDDPNQATVQVRTTYTCTPKTGQAPPSQPVQEVFQLRKLLGAWIIERAGIMDTGRRR